MGAQGWRGRYGPEGIQEAGSLGLGNEKGWGCRREAPRTMLLVFHCCHGKSPQLTWFTTTDINYLTVSIGQSPGVSCGSQEAKIKVSAELCPYLDWSSSRLNSVPGGHGTGILGSCWLLAGAGLLQRLPASFLFFPCGSPPATLG